MFLNLINFGVVEVYSKRKSNCTVLLKTIFDVKEYDPFLIGILFCIYTVVSVRENAVTYIQGLSCKLSQLVSTSKVVFNIPVSIAKVSINNTNWCPLPLIATESLLNIKFSVFPLLLLLLVILSSPHPAIIPIIKNIVSKIKTDITNLLLIPVGFKPSGFLMTYKDKMFKWEIIFLKLLGTITRLIDGFMAGFEVSTLFSQSLYSLTDKGVLSSLRVKGNNSINTFQYFLNQLVDSLCNSVTRISSGVKFSVITFFFDIMIKINRASHLKASLYDTVRYAC